MNNRRTGIVCSNPEVLLEHAFISDTVITTSAAYEPGAVVPHLATLQKPTDDELRPFLANEHTPSKSAIEFINFSDSLAAYLRAHPRQLDQKISPPNQLTVTENTNNKNKLTGLHLDSKENRPIATRPQSERRIGLNVGPGLRYLLLGSLDAFSLTDALDLPDTHTPNTGDVRRYVACGKAALRCLWLPLGRGQAYIAPTELIIHDGSTAGNQESDIRFWIGAPERGVFESAL